MNFFQKQQSLLPLGFDCFALLIDYCPLGPASGAPKRAAQLQHGKTVYSIRHVLMTSQRTYAVQETMLYANLKCLPKPIQS